jgi:hypothetical protein
MESVEIELTVQDITMGTAFTKSIVLDSSNPVYNGKTLKYRALSASEFATAMEKSGYTSEQNPAVSFRFLIEACKLGIVSPGVGKQAGSLDKEVIAQVGGAILGASDVSSKKVESFS